MQTEGLLWPRPLRREPTAPPLVGWYRHLVAAAIVTAALAVFGVEHTPDYSFSLFGTGVGAISLKSKVATAVLGLALVQLLLALWMYGRLPATGVAPQPVRRTTGCSDRLFLSPAGRSALHVRVRGADHMPAQGDGALVGWVLLLRCVRCQGPTGTESPAPAGSSGCSGGGLITIVGVLWYSSALWFFDDYHLPG